MIGTHHIFPLHAEVPSRESHALSDLTASTLPQSSLQHARRRILRSRILRASKLVPETLFTNMTMATFETLFASRARWTSPPTTESLALSLYLPNSAYDHRTDQARCFGSFRPILAGQGQEKSAAPPTPAYMNYISVHHLINTTLAGVAQSVERVALMTAKR
jgi:hypothetical protein